MLLWGCDMVYTIDKILKRYGLQLQLKQGQREESFRGFLQPSRSKSLQNLQMEFSPLGQIPDGMYVLLAPAYVNAERGDTVELKDKSYELRRVEKVMYGDKTLYIWALCREKGGEDTWAMRS